MSPLTCECMAQWDNTVLTKVTLWGRISRPHFSAKSEESLDLDCQAVVDEDVGLKLHEKFFKRVDFRSVVK